MGETFVKFSPTSLKFLISRVLVKRKNTLNLPRFYVGIQAKHKKQYVVSGTNKRNLDIKSGPFPEKEHPNIVNSTYGMIFPPEIPFHELIFQTSVSWENKTALCCASTKREFTYSQMKNHAKTLASILQNKFNLTKGTYIASVVPNCIEFPIILLATSMCGLIITPVNFGYTVEEIKMQISECNVKLIFTDVESHQKCLTVTKELNVSIPMVVVKFKAKVPTPEGTIDMNDLLNQSNVSSFNPVEFNPDDDFVVPFSSGTTGKPKGVQLTHKNIVNNICQVGHTESLIFKPTTETYQDTVLGVLPMYHIYGLVIVVCYTLTFGCRVVVFQRFDPRIYLSNLKKKKANILFVVPPLIKFLAHRLVSKRYLKSVEYMVNAAAPLPVIECEVLLNKAPQIKIGQGYGMTESSPVLTHTHETRLLKLSSIGTPVVSTRMRVVDIETGEILPKGQTGEIQATGPQIMKGYLNRPEETAHTVQDGWLRTGDIGYFDDDGDFYIVDRLKDLIKVKGYQVAPAELEDIIREHPRVKDVAVIGIPNPEYGEIPKAFVVLKRASRVSEDEIKALVSSKLSSYKHLKGGVEFVDDLPKNPTGKTVRRRLKKQ